MRNIIIDVCFWLYVTEKFTTIEFLLSPNCNLTCKYCYQKNDIPEVQNARDFHSQGGVVASQEIIDKFIKFVTSEGIRFVIFYGGEPLLMWNTIKYIVNEISKIDSLVKFSMVTNGTLLNNNIIDFISKNNFSMVLSLDGNKERQDSMRGGFEKISKWFQILSKMNEKVEINIQAAKIKGLYENAIRYVWSQGLRKINLNMIEDYGWYNSEDVRLFEKEYEKAINGMLNDEGILKDVLRIYNLLKAQSYEKSCGVTDIGLSMDWHGDFYPCVKGYELGKKYSIGNVWSGIDERSEQYVRSAASKAYSSESSGIYQFVEYCPIEIYKKTNTFEGEWNSNYAKMLEVKQMLVGKYYKELHQFVQFHSHDSTVNYDASTDFFW